VKDEDGVADDAAIVADGLTERAVVDTDLGQRVARGEAKITDDVVAGRWRRIVRGRERAGDRQDDNRGSEGSHHDGSIASFSDGS
jgi:hypothetical protein